MKPVGKSPAARRGQDRARLRPGPACAGARDQLPITRSHKGTNAAIPTCRLGPGDARYFEHRPPRAAAGATFVFFNALTGDAASWDAVIGPALRAQGHGTLLWNFCGQKDSPFGTSDAIGAGQIAADAVRLLEAERPLRPVCVGLSIGGLFAAQAHLADAACAGLLLINTLRKAGPRLEWVNAAVHRAALTGGGRLIQDLFVWRSRTSAPAPGAAGPAASGAGGPPPGAAPIPAASGSRKRPLPCASFRAERGQNLLVVIEQPEMAGPGKEACLTARDLAGEPAGDGHRHLGVGLAMPEHDRNPDVGQAKTPRPAEQHQVVDCAVGTRA